MINFNFSDVKDNFAPLPAGRYEVALDQIEKTTSSNGKPMLKAVFKPISALSTSEDVGDVDFSKKKIYHNFVLTLDCLWTVKKYLEVLGYDVSNNLDLDPSELIGRTCGAILTTKEYQGKTNNEIKEFFEV